MGRILNYLNAAAYVANLLVTFIVGTTNAVRKTNSQVSSTYPTLFTPAGWAFSIWGIIFTLEGLFAVYQLTSRARDLDAIQRGVGPWWIMMVAVQAGWTFAFSLESIPLSMFFMICIWLSLQRIVVGVRRHLPDPTPAQRLCIIIPFSLNFGWITAAALANANILAVYRDASDYASHLAVAACSLVAAGVAAIAAAAILHPPDGVFCLVLVWASTAISQNLRSPKDAALQNWPSYVTGGLSTAAAALAVWSAAMALWGFGGGRKTLDSVPFATRMPASHNVPSEGTDASEVKGEFSSAANPVAAVKSAADNNRKGATEALLR